MLSAEVESAQADGKGRARSPPPHPPARCSRLVAPAIDRSCRALLCLCVALLGLALLRCWVACLGFELHFFLTCSSLVASLPGVYYWVSIFLHLLTIQACPPLVDTDPIHAEAREPFALASCSALPPAIACFLCQTLCLFCASNFRAVTCHLLTSHRSRPSECTSANLQIQPLLRAELGRLRLACSLRVPCAAAVLVAFSSAAQQIRH